MIDTFDTTVPHLQDDRRSRQVLVVWDLALLVLLPICAVQVGGGHHGAGVRAAAFAFLAVLTLAQLWLTVRVFGSSGAPVGDRVGWWARPVTTRETHAVVAVVCVATAGAMVCDVGTAVLLLVVVSQVFALATRVIVAAVIAVVLVGIAAASRAPGTRSVPWSTWVEGGAIVVGSICAAAFTLYLMRQSRQRGLLIEQLRATREELAQAHHEMGRRDEHARLSRDIHDTLAQGFTSLVLLLEAAEAMVGRDDAVLLDRLQLAQDIARENLREARSLVASGAAVPVDESPLETALERLCARVGRELGIEVRLAVTGAVRRLDTATYVLIMRACQEALSNVRRHARATEVTVSLTYHPQGVKLLVADDGRGFGATVEPGFGLTGMRARAQQIGGRFEIDSAPGEGTRVLVEAP